MRVILFLFFFSIAGSASQSLVLSGTAGAGTVPNVPPFTQLGSFRLEARIHNMAPTGMILHNPIFEVTTQTGGAQAGFEFAPAGTSSQRLCTTDAADSGAGDITCTPQNFSLTGLDVVIRLQRDVVNSVLLTDIINYQTGAIIVSASVNMGLPSGARSFVNTIIFGSPNAICDVAWVKWSSTLVPLGAAFSFESAPADLGDWRFEGTLLSSAAPSIPLNLTGTTYTNSPTYPPACNAGTSQSFRAGSRASLDGTGSIPLDGGTSLSYFWQQIPSPLPDIRLQPLRWTSHTAPNPTVSGFSFGPMNFQLTVEQGDGRSTTCTVHHGAVATDANGTVILDTGNAAFNKALTLLLDGPQVQLGKNPWPFYDTAAISSAALHIAEYDIASNSVGFPSYYENYWDTAAPGTVDVSVTGTVTGHGTNFLSTICNSNGTPSGPGWMFIWWPTGRVSGGVPETSRWSATVSSCASDTAATISYLVGALKPGGGPAGTGLSYSYYPAGYNSDWAFNAAPANYYDQVQAFYELYFRSGIDTYLIAARNLADRWWTNPWMDRGTASFGGQFGRANSLSGLVLRAFDNADGHADMWAGLWNYWLVDGWYYLPDLSALNGSNSWGYQGSMDPREWGYTLAQEAYCALFDPDANLDAPPLHSSTGTGNMTHQAWCRGNLAASFNAGSYSIWPIYLDGPEQGWLSWWQVKSTFDGGGGMTGTTAQSWSGSTVQLTNGSSTVSCAGANCGWQAADFVQYNTAGNSCSSGATCGYVPVLFTDSATFPADSSHTDSTTYCYPNPCTFIDSNHFTLDRQYQGTTGTHGWVFGVSGGKAGSGYGQVGWGQDSFMEGILGWAFRLAGEALACTSPGVPTNCDDTAAALAYSYSQKAATWLQAYAYMPSVYGFSYFAGTPECSPPVSSSNIWCTAVLGELGQREIMGDSFRGLMASYQISPTPALGNLLDTFYSGMWAKPGSVPSPPVASPDGTYDNNFDTAGCTVSGSYPLYSSCGSNGYYLTDGPPYSQKFFGQHFGISNQASWPAMRIGGLLPSQLATVYVSGRMADVPGATRFEVTVTEPTGIMRPPVVCSSSPCAVTVDQAAGNPTVQVAYLSGSGVVLRHGEPFVITIN